MKKAIEVLLVAGIGLLSCGGGFAESPEKEITWKRDNSVMVLIPAGEFTMGSNEYRDEYPPHKVYLDTYYIDKHEVTLAQFKKFCRATGHKMPDQPEWNKDNHPVGNVNWYGTKQYAKWAGKRLPTEAEWEKACRAGSKDKYCFGDDESKLDKYAWYKENSGNRTHPVDQKKPNQWGVHDMHGNVWEWCADWYAGDYYKNSRYKNPKGPSTGGYRVIRSGAWSHSAKDCRSANRFRPRPGSRSTDIGFRCVASRSVK